MQKCRETLQMKSYGANWEDKHPNPDFGGPFSDHAGKCSKIGWSTAGHSKMYFLWKSHDMRKHTY